MDTSVIKIAGHVCLCVLLMLLFLQTPGSSGESIRSLPPSAISDPSNFDAIYFLEKNKGKPMESFVEHVWDGSTLQVYLFPEFNFVQLFMAGIQVSYLIYFIVTIIMLFYLHFLISTIEPFSNLFCVMYTIVFWHNPPLWEEN